MTWGPLGEKLRQANEPAEKHQIDDIIYFRLDKCAKATFKRGRLADSRNIELEVNTVI